MIGLFAHGRGEVAKRPGAGGNGLGATVQVRLARALDHFGAQHTSVGVDGDDHGEFTVEFLPAALGEVQGAALFNLAPQGIVVLGISHFPRGGADVVLARARVVLVDALLNLGQQLEQLPAFFLQHLLGGVGFFGLRWGQLGQQVFHLCQQQGLLFLQRGHLLLHGVCTVACGGGGGRRQGRRCTSAALFATARQLSLGQSLGLVGRHRHQPRVDQDHVEWGVFEQAIKLRRRRNAQAQHSRVHAQ